MRAICIVLTVIVGFQPLIVWQAAQASAPPAESDVRFDVVCALHGRVIVDHTADLNQDLGYLGPWDWKLPARYAIDLRQRRYQDLNWKNGKVQKIVRIAHPRFWLSEDTGSFERFNLRTNRYYSRSKFANYLIEIANGRCRRAPFSGFSSIAAPPVALPVRQRRK